MVFNDKTSHLFEGTRETHNISLSRLKEEKIVLAFPILKSDHKTGLLNGASFEDLVSPENLRNA